MNEVFREDRPSRRLQRSIERVRAATASLAAVQYDLVPNAAGALTTHQQEQPQQQKLLMQTEVGAAVSSPVRSTVTVQLEPYRKRERGAAETARDALAEASSELSSSLEDSAPSQ